jgi:hypothetical protein
MFINGIMAFMMNARDLGDLKVVDYNNWFNSGLSFATVLKIMSLG